MTTKTDSTPSAVHSPADEILAFWFGTGEEHGKSRAAWFKKDPAFDNEIRSRFLRTYELAASGQLSGWNSRPQTCLALIVVLDQFPRNIFRGDPRTFATDALAREATLHALEQGFDLALKPVERQFIYLPLEHSEALADQQQCVKLMQALSGFAETRDLHVWAEKHLVIITRFGRFPHRNAGLGRDSTPEEIEFLKQPGSGF
ncbi:MAG: DUF924 domain-containing protein [Burkholderiales bacterium]|nr:DUF924 domain-containing protein [Burkholderiales bacterium]